MLRSNKDLYGYAVVATDGEVGSVYDFYFDDEAWAVRYLVVDTGKWLPGRLVLISPISINQPDWSTRTLPVALTRDQVKQSPPIETERPVSRQQEAALFDYYGYPYYWAGTGLWGAAPYPVGPGAYPAVPPTPPPPGPVDVASSAGDHHLRSSKEVTGYHLRAADGELGHVEDFLLDDVSWAIRYVVVDTSNWWFGRKVVIAPDWISHVDWMDRKVTVDMSRQSVKDAPRYDSVAHVNRQWESAYYAHHQRAPYWLSEDEAREVKASHESRKPS